MVSRITQIKMISMPYYSVPSQETQLIQQCSIGVLGVACDNCQTNNDVCSREYPYLIPPSVRLRRAIPMPLQDHGGPGPASLALGNDSQGSAQAAFSAQRILSPLDPDHSILPYPEYPRWFEHGTMELLLRHHLSVTANTLTARKELLVVWKLAMIG